MNHLVTFIIFVIIISPVLFYINQVIIENTYLGQRLETTSESEDLLTEETRGRLYLEGYEYFIKNPIIGLGLAQFRVHSRYNLYTHSDIMELLSTTGIIGAILFYYIYIVLWKRINKLLKVAKGENMIYRLNLFKVIIISIIFYGLFKPNFLDILTMVNIAVISGYIYYLFYHLAMAKHKKTIERKVPSEQAPAY